MENDEAYESECQEYSLPNRWMDGIDIYLSAIVEVFKQIEEEGRKRTSRKKTGNPHDGKPHHHITLDIHVEKEEQSRRHAR